MPLVPYGRILMARDPGILIELDFRTYALGAAGAASSINNALFAFQRTAATETSSTVQTSPTTLIASGLGANIARIGQYGTDKTTRGLVMEHSESGYGLRDLANASFQSSHGTGGGGPTITTNVTPGPDGVSNADRWTAVNLGQAYSFWNGSSSNNGSLWVKGHSASQTWQGGAYVPAGATYLQTQAVTTSWMRIDILSGLTGSNLIVVTNDSLLLPGANTGPLDVDIDFMTIGPLAAGYGFMGESLNNVAPGSRNPDSLSLINTQNGLSSGRLGLEFLLKPKGGATQYGADMSVFYIDANNHCEFNHTTRRLNLTMNGVAFNPVTALSWNGKDDLWLWVETGGGSLQSAMKVSVNGVVTDLGTSGAPAPSIAAATALYLLNKNVTGTVSQTFSSWCQVVRFYKNGRRPGWAS